MGWGLVLPSFLPSCHLLKSSTFKTNNITAAIRKTTWKNWIIETNFFAVKLAVLTILLPEIISLFEQQAGQHDQNGSGSKTMVRKWHRVNVKIPKNKNLSAGQTITCSMRLNPSAGLTFSHKIL